MHQRRSCQCFGNTNSIVVVIRLKLFMIMRKFSRSIKKSLRSIHVGVLHRGNIGVNTNVNLNNNSDD